MTDPHLGFIVAAYAISFAVVGAMMAWIVLRHRTLRGALARLGETGKADREHA